MRNCHRGTELAIEALLRLQPYERATKRDVAYRVGNVEANSLWQQKIIEPDLQTSQRILVGNVVDRTVTQYGK